MAFNSSQHVDVKIFATQRVYIQLLHAFRIANLPIGNPGTVLLSWSMLYPCKLKQGCSTSATTWCTHYLYKNRKETGSCVLFWDLVFACVYTWLIVQCVCVCVYECILTSPIVFLSICVTKGTLLKLYIRLWNVFIIINLGIGKPWAVFLWW